MPAKSGFGGCQENYTCTVTSVNLGRGGGVMVWGYFSGVVLGSLAPVKGSLNSSGYKDILSNFMFLNLWEQFGDGPPSSSNMTAYQCTRSIKTCMCEVEECE